MCGCAVNQHLCFLDGVGGGRSLLGADSVERDEHGGVDGARDVDKGADNALHAHDAAVIHFRCGCGVGRVLHLGPIRRREPFVGKVLREHGHGVLEALQGFADGVGRVDVDVVFLVVPINGKPPLLAVRGVDGGGVIRPECIEEVDGVVGGK